MNTPIPKKAPINRYPNANECPQTRANARRRKQIEKGVLKTNDTK